MPHGQNILNHSFCHVTGKERANSPTQSSNAISPWVMLNELWSLTLNCEIVISLGLLTFTILILTSSYFQFFRDFSSFLFLQVSVILQLIVCPFGLKFRKSICFIWGLLDRLWPLTFQLRRGFPRWSISESQIVIWLYPLL